MARRARTSSDLFMSVAMRQVRTTQVYASEHGDQAEQQTRAEREDEASQWQHRRRNDVRMKHLLEEARKERDDRRL